MFMRSSAPLASVQMLTGRSPAGGGLLKVSE
jgi:hypothetical protein